jgi:hypothetical protein
MVGAANSPENLKDQQRLAGTPETFGDVSRRNASATRREKTGKRRGIGSRCVPSCPQGAGLVPLPDLPSIPSPPIVVERDDGMWSLGWHDDAAGPFPTRNFAEAVRLRQTRHQAKWLRQ